jgi:hypothetical protein
LRPIRIRDVVVDVIFAQGRRVVRPQVIDTYAVSLRLDGIRLALLGGLESHKSFIEQQIVENLQGAGDEEWRVDP